jgi:monoterpene epsilon-lactone hydrolase
VSSEQLAKLDEMMRGAPLDIGGDLAQQRVILEQMLTATPLADDVVTEASELAGIPVVRIDVEGIDSDAVVLYLHGGAYTMGSAVSAAGLASDLGRRAGIPVVAVDYRLAPEHPYPGAIEDAVAAYRGLIQTGTPANRVAIAGESAGAGLTAATLVAIKQTDLPQPACAVMFSPWVDMTLSGESMRTKASVDPALTPDGMRRRADDYMAGADPVEVLASPIHADLSGLPPLLIQVGSHEILLDDAVRLAARAAADDVCVTLEVTPAAPHVFQAFAAVLDEGDAAMDRAGAFLSSHLTG